MGKKSKIIPPIGKGFDDVLKTITKSSLPIAAYSGELPIGGVKLHCVVLKDGRRLLKSAHVFKAFGRNKRGLSKERQKKARLTFEGEVLQLPSFIASNNLKSFIGKELVKVLQLIQYIDGNQIEEGYQAEIIPELCKLYLRARREGRLNAAQQSLAVRAEILYGAFAKVGIIALIDEATGYQTNRKVNALRILVESYVREDARKWTKEFNDAFFEGLDRIYGKEKTHSRNRPPYYGKFINMYIYDPIEQGLILKKIKDLRGTERSKQLHLFLNAEKGLRILRDRIGRIGALLDISSNIKSFRRNYAKMESKQKWFDFYE